MYPLLFIGHYYTFIFDFWQLQNSRKGGTAYTVDYAKRNGLEFFDRAYSKYSVRLLYFSSSNGAVPCCK